MQIFVITKQLLNHDCSELKVKAYTLRQLFSLKNPHVSRNINLMFVYKLKSVIDTCLKQGFGVTKMYPTKRRKVSETLS